MRILINKLEHEVKQSNEALYYKEILQSTRIDTKQKHECNLKSYE